MARALLAWIARRVPILHRQRWREEWEAELRELERRLAHLGALRRDWVAFRFALGAWPHATTLRDADAHQQRARGTMTTMGRDVRFAVRSFRRTPGFTVVAILTLALGIGATTTMFSVLDGVLLRPLPYPAPGELVLLGATSPRMAGLAPVSPADFKDWRDQNTTFAGMAAVEAWSFDLTDGDLPARVEGAGVTYGFFEIVGVAPMTGRTIQASDDVTGAEPVMVISHGLWERRYGSDPEILGRRVTTADQTFTVVGVMPPGFVHPEALWSDDVDIWVPQAMTGSNMETRQGRYLQVIGRVAPGTSVYLARQEMTAIGRALAEQFPATNADRDVLVEPLREETLGDVGQGLVLLMGAVGMLLLIACVNVANLFMARATERSREIAVRAALGAGTRRIRTQLLTEGVVLSLVGGVAGVAVAYAGVAGFRAINPGGVPRLADVTVDARILAFAALVSVLTGIAFAMLPALRLGRARTLEALKDGGRGGSAGADRGRLRNALVAVELGLAMMLLVGAGLFVNSFLRLSSVDPGFDARNTVTMSVNLNSAYPDVASQAAYFAALTDRLSTVPGTESVGYVSTLPFDGNRWITGYVTEGADGDPNDPDYCDYVLTGPGALATLGVDVVAGREFTTLDDAASEPVIMVNETFARRAWPGENAVGKRVGLGQGRTWHTVIGVAADINRSGLDRPADPEMYRSPLQRGIQSAQVVLRTEADPATIVPIVRQRTWELDGTLPLEFSTMEAYVASSMTQPQFYTQLFAAFAAVALLLAGVGVYGTMSYTVGQRTQEMGIRLALGARSGQVLGMVARQGMAVAVLGLAAGLVAALVGARVVEGFLFGVSARDPLTYALGAGFLGLVALAACYLPARRAGRADPMRALRAE